MQMVIEVNVGDFKWYPLSGRSRHIANAGSVRVGRIPTSSSEGNSSGLRLGLSAGGLTPRGSSSGQA